MSWRAEVPAFQHAVATYASEANETVGLWRAVSDDLLDCKPHAKGNTIRTIQVHHLLSEHLHSLAGERAPHKPLLVL